MLWIEYYLGLISVPVNVFWVRNSTPKRLLRTGRAILGMINHNTHNLPYGRCNFIPSIMDGLLTKNHIHLGKDHLHLYNHPTTAVAVTQISAYITHKNLAVCKIMEAMHTAYAIKQEPQSQHVSSKTWHKWYWNIHEYERKAHMVANNILLWWIVWWT